MSTPNSNQVAFLRTSRNFPEEAQPLSVEIDRMYLDVANAVNSRIIGQFPINRPSVTGENWFIDRDKRQQTQRQTYVFTSTASIAHGIQVTNANQFTRCFGSYTNGTNSYAIIWGSSVAIAGQISFYVTATQIVFLVGAGAPSLTNGRVVLEWLSSP